MKFQFLLLFLVSVLVGSVASAATSSQTFTVDGQLFLTGTTTPLLDGTAKITIYIMNPAGTCLLYAEEQTVDTVTSNGYFNVQVGSDTGAGKRVGGLDPGRTMVQVYANNAAIAANNVPGQTCAGGTYTPANGDGRLVRVIVTPTAGSPDTLTPDLAMDLAPMSKVAETIQGLAPASLLQVNNSGSVALTQTNLESAFTGSAWTNIQAVMAGTYGGVSSVSASAGSANLPSISFSGDANTGFYSAGANQIGVAANGAALFSIGASGMVSATTGGAAVTTAAGTAAEPTFGFAGDAGLGWFRPAASTLAASTGGVERIRITPTGDLRINGSTSGYVGLRAPAVAGSGILTLPATVGTSGQTLVTDGSGVLSWATASGGGSSFPVALGTSAAPSMNFSGDTNTGIYSPGADLIAVSTSGVERLRVDATGYVGMGVTTPLAHIHLKDLQHSGEVIRMEATNPDHRVLYFSGENNLFMKGIYDTYESFTLGYNANIGRGVEIEYGTRNASIDDGTYPASMEFAPRGQLGTRTAIHLDKSGWVGIGKKNPGAQLDVKDTMRISGSTSGYVGLRAPAVAGSGILTLPSTVGTSGQTLVTDGSGVLSWTAGGAAAVFPIALGTSAAPSMNFSGDTNTGFYSAGADTVAISTSGVERLRVNNSGYVGIGTTSPISQLNLAGNISSPAWLVNGIGLQISEATYTDTTSSGTINTTVNRIGIPTLAYSSPTTLNSASTLRIEGAPVAGTNATLASANAYALHVVRGHIVLGTAGSSSIAITSGVVSTGGTDTVTSPGFTWSGDPNTGLWHPAADTVAVTTSGAERMRIDPSGYIGIGTTSPTAKLEVAGGDLRIAGSTSGYVGLRAPAVAGSGILTLPSTVGTSGQTLVTDGSGVLSWATASGGGSSFPVALGTSAAPSMNFSGDTNTGIYSPGADLIAVSTSGVERLRVDATGYVGIGTTAPSDLLHILKTSAGASTAPLIIQNNSTTANTEAMILLAPTSSPTTRYAAISGVQQGANVIDLAMYTGTNSGVTEKARITANGDFGIGTATPNSRLEVKGGALTVADGSTNILDGNTVGNIAFRSYDVSGATAGEMANIKALAVGNFSANVNQAALTFWTNSASTPAATEKMRIDHNGNVGIGTTAPLAKLSIGTGSIANADVPVQISTGASGTESNYAVNKNGGYGFLLGYKYGTGIGSYIYTGGYLRQVTTDPFSVVVNNNIVSTQWASDGSIGFGGSITDTSHTGAKMVLNSSGNVGIGTTSPTARLEIAGGDLRINGSTSGYVGLRAPVVAGSGVLTLPATVGTSGQTLVTDGSGVLSWATASGGGSSFPVALGTSAAPSMNFSGDTNTGIYSPGADLIAVSTSGVERLRVDATGYVGIGTTTPGAPLDVRGTTSPIILTRSASTSGSTNIELQKSRGSLASPTVVVNGDYTGGILAKPYDGSTFLNTADIAFRINGTVAAGSIPTDIVFRPGSTGPAEAMRITSSGNVGIGTTSPTARLEIAGGDLRINGSTSGYVGLRAPAVAGSGILTLPSTVGTSGQTLVTDGSGVLSWATASGGGGGFPVALGTSAAPSMNFSGDTDTGIYSPGANTVAIATSAAERVRISSTGFVGIGNTNPEFALHITEPTQTTGYFNPTLLLDGQSAGTDGGPYMQFRNRFVKDLGRIVGNDSGTFGGHLLFYTKVADGDGNGVSTEKMRITSSGNVGIGSTAPDRRLYVADSVNGLAYPLKIDNYYSSGGISGAGILFSVDGNGGSGLAEARGKGGLIFQNSDTWNRGDFHFAINNVADASNPTLANSVMVIKRTGNVGIGTTNPSSLLTVQSGTNSYGMRHTDGNIILSTYLGGNNGWIGTDSNHNLAFYTNGSTSRMFIDTSGFVGIGTSNPTALLTVDNGTTIGTYTTGGWQHTSDARLKKDVKTIDKGLEKVLQLRGVEYKFIKDKENKTQLGFIAQETEKVFPEAVVTDNAGTKSMNYANLVAPVVEAIKELNGKLRALFYKSDNQARELSSLKEENTQLKSKMDKIEKENALIKAHLCKQDPAFCR